MKYVEKVLEPGEQVIKEGYLHVIVYFESWWCIALAVLCGAAAIGAHDPDTSLALTVFAGFMTILAIPLSVFGLLRRRTTEFVVTDRRVISKVGIIRRDVSEINRLRVEGVEVKQSILGRVLGYGAITVTGTGGNMVPMSYVRAPLEFRRAVTAQRP